jgi:predicted metalloprotease with PDZ domain
MAALLLVRLTAHDGPYLLDSLKDAGYSLGFRATESTIFAQQEQEDGVLDLSYSIGARIRPNGVVQGVSWDSAAFKAGLVPGMTVTAINGEAFSFAALRSRLAGWLSRPDSADDYD